MISESDSKVVEDDEEKNIYQCKFEQTMLTLMWLTLKNN